MRPLPMRRSLEPGRLRGRRNWGSLLGGLDVTLTEKQPDPRAIVDSVVSYQTVHYQSLPPKQLLLPLSRWT